jgi:hypothetical protein
LQPLKRRWDGKQLISSGGNVFIAPGWFVRNFLDKPLDGESWMGRGAMKIKKIRSSFERFRTNSE